MWWLIVAIALGLVWPAPTAAQELIVQQQPQQQEGTPDVAAVPTKEEPRRIDPIVVTATMSPTSLEKLGAAVTVITGEEITNLNFDRISSNGACRRGRRPGERPPPPFRRRRTSGRHSKVHRRSCRDPHRRTALAAIACLPLHPWSVPLEM